MTAKKYTPVRLKLCKMPLPPPPVEPTAQRVRQVGPAPSRGRAEHRAGQICAASSSQTISKDVGGSQPFPGLHPARPARVDLRHACASSSARQRTFAHQARPLLRCSPA